MEFEEKFHVMNKLCSLNISDVDQYEDKRSQAKALLLKYEDLYQLYDKCQADHELKIQYGMIKVEIMKRFYKIFGITADQEISQANNPTYVPLIKCTPTMLRSRIRNKFKGTNTNIIPTEIDIKYNRTGNQEINKIIKEQPKINLIVKENVIKNPITIEQIIENISKMKDKILIIAILESYKSQNNLSPKAKEPLENLLRLFKNL